MKEQNSDIPFIVHGRLTDAHIKFNTDAEVNATILDPRGALVEYAGSYSYVCKAEVVNAARALRDTRKLAPKAWLGLKLGGGSNRIEQELGKAIEAMATEIRALKKERK